MYETNIIYLRNAHPLQYVLSRMYRNVNMTNESDDDRQLTILI